MDLEELLDQMGEPLDPNSYDWTTARDVALTEDEVFQLTYAAQVEWGTEGTFKSLDISRDPVVHRFLRIWLRQEIVHAELFARFLAEYGVDVPPVHRSRRQRFAAWRGAMVNRAARAVTGPDFFGVHMSWGAVNELTTLRFYGVIRERTANPLLRTLLRDVMAQEALHYSFYWRAATDRLAENTRGQRIVRFALAKLWSPVGTGLRTVADADRIILDIFSDEPKQVSSIDAAIARIPGLEGLELTRRSLESALARRAA